MKKNTNLCVDLKTIMQNDTLLTIGVPYNGILTQTDEDHYMFQEEAKGTKAPGKRNPQVFSGKYITLSIGKDGRPQPHFRRWPEMKTVDCRKMVFDIYSELLDAIATLPET